MQDIETDSSTIRILISERQYILKHLPNMIPLTVRAISGFKTTIKKTPKATILKSSMLTITWG